MEIAQLWHCTFCFICPWSAAKTRRVLWWEVSCDKAASLVCILEGELFHRKLSKPPARWEVKPVTPDLEHVCVWGLELPDPSGRELEARQVQTLDKSEKLLGPWCKSMQFKWSTQGNKRCVMKVVGKVTFLSVCLSSDRYKINISAHRRVQAQRRCY